LFINLVVIIVNHDLINIGVPLDHGLQYLSAPFVSTTNPDVHFAYFMANI